MEYKVVQFTPKIAPKVDTYFLYNIDIFWHSPKKSPKYLDYFFKTICCQELVKIAKSGHTGHLLFSEQCDQMARVFSIFGHLQQRKFPKVDQNIAFYDTVKTLPDLFFSQSGEI